MSNELSEPARIILEMTDNAIRAGTLSREDAGTCRRWVLAHELDDAAPRVRLSGEPDTGAE